MRAKFVCLSILLAVATALSGQEFRGTITGRILDPAGATVPGATIQVKNLDTNVVTTVATDITGVYSVPFLQPGRYTMTVEAAGFKKVVRENVTVQVGQLAGINISLEVGAVTEAVTVTAEAPLLESETASRSGVVNSLQVANLPLNARNPYLLGAMMSGVLFRGASIWQRPFDNGAIAEWMMNGSLQRNNEFLLDGAPNNAQAGLNNVAYVPIVDAVQEFRVQTNSYDAQYGHTGGGVMNVVLKSGGNNYHFTGWEFMRRQVLDANTFQNNSIRAARAAHTLDQYGGQVSGPLVIPKLYNGRNKTFFLGSFENYKELTPNPLRISLPQPEFLTGDFSNLRNPAGQLVEIYNPFSGRADPSAPGGWRRDPFPGNRIPTSMLNPIALKILSYFPKPNTPTPPGQRYGAQTLQIPDYFNTDLYYNLILKFDQNWGNNHRMFFRHASNDRTEDRAINGIIKGPGMDGQQPFQRINDTYVLDWVGTLTPTFVVNVRASNNRFIEKGEGSGNRGFDLTTLGFPAATVGQLPGGPFFGRYAFTNYNTLGRYVGVNITNNYGLNVNVAKAWRGHSFKAGIDIRRIHYILGDTGNIWNFDTNVAFTQRTYNSGDTTSGDSIASFLLGLPGGSSNYPLFPFYRQWYYAPFIQDDWKVSRRLTLNLGLRWDINLAPDEKYNRMNYIFDANAASPIAGQIDKTRFPQYANLKGGLTFAGVGGNPTKIANTDWTNFEPRIGVAYQLSSKLILRGGFGITHLNPNNDWMTRQTGFSTSTPLNNSLDGGRTPARTDLLSNPYPGGILRPSGAADGLSTFAGRDFDHFNPDFVVPRQHQFSFGLQYLLPAESMLDVSYVGGRGYDYQMTEQTNNPSLDFRKQCNIFEGGSPVFCNELLPNPFRNIDAFQGTTYFTAATISRYNLARPFPQFTGGNNLRKLGVNESRTWYNSLQINYNVRMKGGLSLLGNYTWSKFMERWGYNDEFKKVFQQGLYFADRPHVFKLTALYSLPFGRGKKFAGGVGSGLDKLIGGWEITTIYTANSGEPANLPGNATILRDPRIQSVDFQQYQVRGWTACALRMADNGTTTRQNCAAGEEPAWLVLPNFAPRTTTFRSGQVRMSRVITMDASLNKNIKFGERLNFQFRAEAFNVMNHYVQGAARYNTDPNSANFGSIFPGSLATTQTGFPRQIQLGFKILW